MQMELLSSAICVLFSLVLWVDHANAQSEATTIGTKCYRNEDLGEYPANIYYCQDTTTPECCEEEGEFTCCETKTDRTLKHQFILWGAVFGVVGAIAIIWMCYRKDTYLCEGETLSKRMKRCCGGEKKIKPDDEVDLSDLSNEKGSVSSLETTKTTGYYDEHVPVTTRGVTPVVHKDAARADETNGNDSDSGRGSTLSVDGSGNAGAHKPRAGSSLGEGPSQGQGHDLHSNGEQNSGIPDKKAGGGKSQKEKKKKKKNKKNKSNSSDDVIEEVEEIE